MKVRMDVIHKCQYTVAWLYTYIKYKEMNSETLLLKIFSFFLLSAYYRMLRRDLCCACVRMRNQRRVQLNLVDSMQFVCSTREIRTVAMFDGKFPFFARSESMNVINDVWNGNKGISKTPTDTHIHHRKQLLIFHLASNITLLFSEPQDTKEIFPPWEVSIGRKFDISANGKNCEKRASSLFLALFLNYGCEVFFSFWFTRWHFSWRESWNAEAG